MKMPKSDIPDAQNERKKRLADALRHNLQLRKARARAGEQGESQQKALEPSKKDKKD